MNERVTDWTRGAQALVYQCCKACGGVQYFHRAFCAACGASDPETLAASGRGRVYATSLVCRAATAEAKAHVPYNIVLLDCDEGFRMMAHGQHDLRIGDAVLVGFETFAGRLVPYARKVE